MSILGGQLVWPWSLTTVRINYFRYVGQNPTNRIPTMALKPNMRDTHYLVPKFEAF